jgi:dTDP-L-rhamnose 4-epimerase
VRILVTGGAGFIGSHVVDALLARGHDVAVLDVLDPSVHARSPDYLDGRAELIVGDVRDAEAVSRALRGADAASHQAALVGLGRGLADAPRYASVNDVGTATLLRAACEAKVERLVLASSMVVYGEGAYRCAECGPRRPRARRERDLAQRRFEPRCASCGGALEPQPVQEDAALAPRSVYAATKVHQEHLAFVAMNEGGPAVTALRYHNVYGPRMPRDTPYAGVASLFRSQLAAGMSPHVYEDGGQTRDFVYVRDVARANVLALERDEPAVGAYNIGSGEPHTVLELATALTRALGAPPPVVTQEYRLSDVRHIFASSARAARDLGYHAEVPFANGIGDFASAPLREPGAAR